MSRVVLMTVAGGLMVYATYLMIHGESPNPVQRVISSVPAPITDSTMQPRVSGSVSSITQVIAQTANDPTLSGRPTALGGNMANTGTDQAPVTSTSMDVEPLQNALLENSAFCENNAFVSSINGQGPKYGLKAISHQAMVENGPPPHFDVGKWETQAGRDATLNEFWQSLGHEPDLSQALTSHNCTFDFTNIHPDVREPIVDVS